MKTDLEIFAELPVSTQGIIVIASTVCVVAFFWFLREFIRLDK